MCGCITYIDHKATLRTEKAGTMLKRNLIYTGVTRARELCVIMASPQALKKAVKDNSYAKRLTMLAKWISELDFKMKKNLKRRV